MQPSLGLNLSIRKTRKRVFLEEMEQVVPWAALLAVVQPFHGQGRTGRPAFSLETMLRIHFLQQWFGFADEAMEEALFDTALYREFALLGAHERLPDAVTLLRFRHLLEKHELAPQLLAAVNGELLRRGLTLKSGSAAVDATIIDAPSSTKNRDQARDPEMHQTKKGNQFYFGMKAHIAVDAASGLVTQVAGTAANVNDVVMGNALLGADQRTVYADAGYQGAGKREDARPGVTWQVAMRPGKRRALDKGTICGRLADEIERLKAGIRSKVEHVFRVLKRQFGYVKVRYRGLAKNTAQITTLLALGNLWLARHELLGLGA